MEPPRSPGDRALDHARQLQPRAEIQQRVAQMLPSFPTEVQTAWKNTQNTPVYLNEPGAYPTPVVR